MEVKMVEQNICRLCFIVCDDNFRIISEVEMELMEVLFIRLVSNQ